MDLLSLFYGCLISQDKTPFELLGIYFMRIVSALSRKYIPSNSKGFPLLKRIFQRVCYGEDKICYANGYHLFLRQNQHEKG